MRTYMYQMNAINEYPNGPRRKDLWRLTWTKTDAGKIIPYGGMTRFGRARMFPSDYFPDFIDSDGKERKLTSEDFQNEFIVPIAE